ncbi:MAG TPA: hypothetical protein VF742_11670, partial [Terracidiphilus sp.]
KQALAIPVSKPAYLERTPADLPFSQYARFAATGQLSDKGELTAHIEQSFHGDMELLVRSAFRQVPQSQWKEFVQKFSGRMGFAGEVQKPEASPVEQIGEPFQFSYDYTREKFGEWEDRRIGPPMPPVGWEKVPGAREIKPADDVEIGSPGEQDYKTKVQLPQGWVVMTHAGIDLKEDWAEYHSSYNFANGTFTAERKLVMKKEKVPLSDWDKYRVFREAIYGDSTKMFGLIGPGSLHGAVGALVSGPRPGVITTEASKVITAEASEYEEFQKTTLALQPVRDAMTTLAANPPATDEDRAKAAASCRSAVNDFESHSQELGSTYTHSLRWAQVLSMGWTCVGWSALETQDLGTAEVYLRGAWQASQSPLAGYELARVLDAKGDKAGAAHLYELASVTRTGSMFAAPPGMDMRQLTANGYKSVTGKELTATPLNDGMYKGSLQEELDNAREIKQFIRATKLSGEAIFLVSYEDGKPAKVTFLNGEMTMASLTHALEGAKFASGLPAR